MSYFAVTLKSTDREIDFQQKCTNVDYTDKHYAVFSSVKDNKQVCLAIIPHEEIKYILNYRGGE